MAAHRQQPLRPSRPLPQAEHQRYEEAAAKHDLAMAASSGRLHQAHDAHAATLADVTAAHKAAIASAETRLAQAEVLIAQLQAEHAEEIAQCDAEYEEAHHKRHVQAMRVGSPPLPALGPQASGSAAGCCEHHCVQ